MSGNLPRVLFVDDEPMILEAMRRQHHHRYDVTTACGPEEALRIVDENDAFAVVVSDHRMPVMCGVDLLKQIGDASPDTVRIMLTGHADLQIAMDAVNGGHVFRFLMKPCDPEILRTAIDDAAEIFRLRTAERDLLDQTVRGSVEVLVEVLALARPRAFGRARKIHHLVRHMAERLELPEIWQHETAALLSQIGCVAVPDDILDRMISGSAVDPRQRAMLGRHTELARRLLRKIPRLQAVAEIIHHQHAEHGRIAAQTGLAVDIGSRMLAAALDLDELISLGARPEQAFAALRADEKKYSARVIEALSSAPDIRVAGPAEPVALDALEVGMVAAEDILDTSGSLILGEWSEITETSLQRLKNLAELGRLPAKPFLVHSLEPLPASAPV